MVKDEEILLDFLTVNSAYESKVIPCKGGVTFLSKITGYPQVWMLNKNGKPLRYIKTDDRVMTVHHSPSGERTVVGVDTGGNEKQQLYLFHRDYKEGEVLVESPEHFHYIGGWSPSGRFISFSSNRRHPGHFDVFVIDVDTKETKQVFRHDANCVPLCWIDDESLIVSTKVTNIDSSLFRVNTRSGEKINIGNDDYHARYEMPTISTEQDEMYVLTDYKEDTLHLCRISLADPQSIEKLLHWDKWDMESIALSLDGKFLAFTLNEGGISRLGIYYPETRACDLIDNLPKGIIDSLSWLSNESFVFTLKTPTNPGDIWKYNLREKKIERLTYIGQPKIAKNFWREPELHAFSSFDGLEVPYFFYNNQHSESKPAVVYVHGGPEGQSKAEYNPVVQYLVYKGFAVAVPNIRGSNGYGRRYLKLDDADKRLDAVEDLACLARELARTHNVIEEKIGIIGRSYGGFMVLSSLTHHPELWAAGVDIVGMSNIRTFLENTGEWRRYLRESEYGSLDLYTEYFEKTAPMNLTHKISAPLLVFHGRNDTRVPVSEAEQLVRDLQSSKKPVELIIFEDEGHQTEKIENHITMHTKTVDFFDHYLN